MSSSCCCCCCRVESAGELQESQVGSQVEATRRLLALWGRLQRHLDRLLGEPINQVAECSLWDLLYERAEPISGRTKHLGDIHRISPTIRAMTTTGTCALDFQLAQIASARQDHTRIARTI